MKISMNKQYQYRNGEPSRILCVDRPCKDTPVVSMGKDGNLKIHTPYGICVYSADNRFDLIEVKPFEIDEPVLVKDDGNLWFRGHYAGLTDDPMYPYKVWAGGSKWTSYGGTAQWRNCRRPMPEELEQQA